MQLHQLKTTNNKSKKRVGRGGKRGTYSGRGNKGQKARAGRKIRPQLRDIIKKIPKKRGYRFSSIQEKPVVLDIKLLNATYVDGEVVSPGTLVEKGLVSRRRSSNVKILGKSKLSKKITVSGCDMSKSVRDMLEVTKKSV
jgi:large subunit ribosomal protein L15